MADKPAAKSSLGNQELDKAEKQFEAFDSNVKQMTMDRMNQAPIMEVETPNIAQQDIAKAKDIYLKYCKFTFLAKGRPERLIKERAAYIKDIASKVDLFIAPSRFIKQKFIESGIPGEKVTFIPYGFNLNNFKNSRKSYSPKLRFGFIGNLLPAKGAHVLIECFNKIKNKDIEVKIYDQAISYKNALLNYSRKIRKIARSKNIKFMGSFDNRKISDILEGIDVLVVPSIWYENSPLVIQEAFMAGTPVIASRIGGIPGLVCDGVNGQLFSPGDIQDLQRKIQYVVDNPDVLERFKENMPKVKSIEDNARELEEIYYDLLKNNNL